MNTIIFILLVVSILLNLAIICTLSEMSITMEKSQLLLDDIEKYLHEDLIRKRIKDYNYTNK